MKRWLYLLLVLVALSACSKSTNKIKIGVSFSDLAEERWTRELELMKEYAKEVDAEILPQSANKDEALQNSQIENLITQRVNVLIILPQNSKSVAPTIPSAKKEGIPTIAYDRFINSKDLDLYITFDNVKVGEKQAETVVKLVPEGNYLWLGGSPTDNNSKLLREGHMKILKPFLDSGKIKLVAEQYCENWSPQEALKHAENSLTANKNNIQAVIASNDGTAGGAIQALAAQGLAGKVPISGQDAELAACQRVAAGTQTVTIFKDIRNLAKEAITAAVELANNKKPAKINGKTEGIDSILLDVIPVTKDNLNDVIVKSSYHKEEDVYKNK